MKGAGGTEGGIVEFLLGLAMAVGGGYLLTNQVTISSRLLGLVRPPHLRAVASAADRGVSGSSSSTARAGSAWSSRSAEPPSSCSGILMNLRIYFEPTSLFNTLIMLVLLAGGLGPRSAAAPVEQPERPR